MNVSSSTTGIEKDLWRLTAPEFETWESRGEITATRNVKQYHSRTCVHTVPIVLQCQSHT